MADDGDTVRVTVRYGKEDIELSVNPQTDTFAEIKAMLEEKTGVAVKDQDLNFNKLQAMEVMDDKNLAYYRFSGGCFMNLEKKK
ncbi:expressed unknown protein [Seminavis robusta]|uniref:Ubiquitin-like domain-containing protein n=1 Tax=Seminavis robusta TaxID=568900 RepID=A0A9N8E6F5_9STRA|nr:expressed unknown protein [Seminavis robusta]|eukprot:Sro700_g189660.1 n/a (84) ;mRNA; r:35003-35254